MQAKQILERHVLTEYISQAKKEGKRIVFTNGCFDLLHAGHVAYLEKAGSFGDILVLALNDDDSVRRLKGPERPLCPLKDRITVMASLRCIDVVTCFAEDTPLELIQAIMPDVLVKGGDYFIETIVGAQEVLDNGGQVEVVPYLDGKSSSELIEKIRESS